MSSIQPKGTLVPPSEPFCISVRGQRKYQIQNNEDKYVFECKDEIRLLRFLLMGYMNGTYYASDLEVKRENANFIKELIDAGNGPQIVKLIAEVSADRRNFRQDALLLSLAICARSKDAVTKRAAYKHLSEICRTPTHLFIFIDFCEQESSDGTGWGKAHKRAVSKWYTTFTENPEKLALIVTKYKKRKKWTHKDIIRLAHIKTNDPAIGFILRYIAKGLDEAKKMYIIDKTETTTEVTAKLDKLAELIKCVEEAATCHSVERLCSLVKQYKLSWEHCNPALLKDRSIWLALLPHMSLEAILRNLGRMTSYGMFAENSEEEQYVLDKISNIGPMHDGRDDLFIVDENELIQDFSIFPFGMRRNVLHPYSILLALFVYKAGNGGKGALFWTPNSRLVEALQSAFFQAFKCVERTGKKFYLAVDVSSSMSQPVLGNSNMQCATAAAAMLMVTARTEEKCIIKGFSDEMVDIEISPEESLDEVKRKLEQVPAGGTDCSKPMIDAMENKIKDIDVFVIYTDNETAVGKCHPFDALETYRQQTGKHDVKLIVCGMCATKFSIANQNDRYMLDVVGFDSAVPAIVSEFAAGHL